MDWEIGERVSLAEAPEQLGTVTEVNRGDVKVVWDDDGVSFYQLSFVPLKSAREQ
jgi:hypothetical protein